MKDWMEYNYILEGKEIIQKLGLKGEIILEFAFDKSLGNFKITTR